MGRKQISNGRWEWFLYYSPWPPILTAWCVGVACGWAWMFALHGTVIDGRERIERRRRDAMAGDGEKPDFATDAVDLATDAKALGCAAFTGGGDVDDGDGLLHLDQWK